MKAETRVGIFILIAISIFIYLSISIRAFRLDRDQFNMYKAYFDDVGGLAVRASVKIAGVEVGWIDSIDLLNDGRAEVIMDINKNYKLAKNAYAMVHQEGLIGTKTLVIDSGDPSTGFLMPGSTLSMPGRTPASVGELLDQFKDIASSIHDIASSFKSVFATRQAENDMRQALTSITKATERFADFSKVLQTTIRENQDNINVTLADLRTSVQNLKTGIPEVKNDIHDASKKIGSAFEQVEDASVQARDTFKEAGQVVEKINTGKGLVGKLINEDETYTDIKKTVRGLKDYVSKTQALMLNVDMHTESMLRHSNSKGYFELKLRPNSDCFYNIQLVSDEFGSIKREETHYVRKDEKGNVLHPSQLGITLDKKIKYADTIERTRRTKNDILFGLQFGKRFDRLAFRIGLFENSFGVGCDYYVPLATDKMHWISTIEAFDLSGTRRLNDTRPHVKWLNKVYFLKNIYSTFGVDDIYSKHSANPFFGGGIRFGDDDLKYFLGYLPIGKAGGK
ncbi:MAG: MlaD family protein [Candidatus Babeliales bacterium]